MKTFLLSWLMLCMSFSWSQKVNVNNVSGTWRLEFAISHTPIMTDEAPSVEAESEYGGQYLDVKEHWVFQNKLVTVVDYPCCWQNSGKFSFNNSGGVVHFQSTGYGDTFYSLALKNDTLTATNPMCTYYFVRDTLDEDILNRLVRRKVNTDCLMGTWEIPVGEVSVDADAIVVSYPWKMVDTFTVNERNLNWYWSKNRFYLDVDGIKRPFRVKKVSLSDGNFILRPERWVKFYIKRDQLEPYLVEFVWLRKVEEEE